MTDHRMNPGLITDILDVLDRHGYASGDDEHVGQAILLLHDLTRIYEGTRTTRSGPLSTRHHPRRQHPNRPAQTADPRPSSRPPN